MLFTQLQDTMKGFVLQSQSLATLRGVMGLLAWSATRNQPEASVAPKNF